MSIARQEAISPERALAVAPVAPTLREPAPIGVPIPLADVPVPDPSTPAGRLRRCTFRRIDRVAGLPQRRRLPVYEVSCLYVDADQPLSLGDLGTAQPFCDGCTAIGIFRPDED